MKSLVRNIPDNEMSCESGSMFASTHLHTATALLAQCNFCASTLFQPKNHWKNDESGPVATCKCSSKKCKSSKLCLLPFCAMSLFHILIHLYLLFRDRQKNNCAKQEVNVFFQFQNRSLFVFFRPDYLQKNQRFHFNWKDLRVFPDLTPQSSRTINLTYYLMCCIFNNKILT